MKLADKYSIEPSGNIQTVLGLEIEYGESRKAALTVWHPLEEPHELGESLAAEAAVSEVRLEPNIIARGPASKHPLHYSAYLCVSVSNAKARPVQSYVIKKMICSTQNHYVSLL